VGQLLAALVGVALVASACANSAPAPIPGPPVTDASSSVRPSSPAQSGPVPGAAGQEPSGATAALNAQLLRRASATGSPGDLPLGPGDLIEIVVFEVPELSNIKVRISRPGVVTLPLIGQVPVTGKTPADLEADLRQRLEGAYMYDPHVTVFVHERRSQRISVIGAVRKGGVYELTGRLRLADALGLAEGLSDDADHVVYLIRRVPAGTVARAQGNGGAGAPAASETGETEEVMTAINLDEVAKGSDELNVQLEAGDVIQVPRAGSIYVGGSVSRPGSIPLKAKTTVFQAILAAGGATNVAALADVRLYRTQPDGKIDVTTMDLNKFEEGAGSPELQKNDVVIVGKSAIKAFFFGVYELFRGMFGVGVAL
jgi:polysaccharide biosynthesis/export protein